MDLLLLLAAPIAYGRRHEFLQAVADALERLGGGSGVGLVHRVAREVQGQFIAAEQRENVAGRRAAPFEGAPGEPLSRLPAFGVAGRSRGRQRAAWGRQAAS